MDKNIFEEGPRRGHAAGDTSIEQQASQLASDIRYKARQKMKGASGSNMSPAQVQALYRSLLGSSTAPGAVKAIVKKKLFKEQVDTGVVPVSEHLKTTSTDVLTRVFSEAEEKKFVIKVVDKATGNTSYRKADRTKIAELRANKNIRSVEITGRKEPDAAYKGDPKPNYGGKKAKKDYDGDGKIESGTAEYMGSRDKAIKKAMAKEEFIADAKVNDSEKKIDIMKGKNTVKINPSLGESIRAELDALKAQRVEEAMAAAKAAGPSPEEKQQLMNKDKMLKKKIMMQKQTMQMQKQGRLPLNYSEEMHDEKKKEEKDGSFDALRTMKSDEKDDPRSMPTKINLAKNKLRAMGLKMSYDIEGDLVDEGKSNRPLGVMHQFARGVKQKKGEKSEKKYGMDSEGNRVGKYVKGGSRAVYPEELSVDQQMKISQDYNRMSPEEKRAANKKAMGNIKKVAPKKDTRTDAEKMTAAVGKPRMGSSD